LHTSLLILLPKWTRVSTNQSYKQICAESTPSHTSPTNDANICIKLVHQEEGDSKLERERERRNLQVLDEEAVFASSPSSWLRTHAFSSIPSQSSLSVCGVL
jgi:hypothetical protein